MRRTKRKATTISESSIILDLKPILEARNIKNGFTALVKMGISTVTVSKILKGQAVQITMAQLTKLCLHLNCTPNDLFALRALPLPKTHPLNTLRTYTDKPGLDITAWLESKTLEEIKALMQSDEKETLMK